MYSWVLPIKDEAESLPQLIREIREVMPQDEVYEIIAINDASIDSSSKFLTSFAGLFPAKLKVISFLSHQGKWAALRAGIERARGEIIITLDSDLQDDPREVVKLLRKLNQGYDLVSGWRKIRFDPFYKVLISKLGNRLVSMLTRKDFKDLNSPFKIYRRHLLQNLPKEGSLLRFSLLFADKLGYKTSEVAVKHRTRLHGQSKFGFVKYLRIIYDALLVILLFTGSGRVSKIAKTR